MLMLWAGVLLFFAPHCVSIVAPHWRDRMLLRVGAARWKGGYSILASIGFTLLVLGFIEARRVPVVLYISPALMRPVSLLLMLPVFPLLLATYFPGRFLARVQHPLLSATLLWATAHLLSNGRLPDVVLFGSFLLWALADRLSVEARAASRMRRAAPTRYNDVLAIVLGLGLYALTILKLHGWLFGVPLRGEF